MPEFQNLPSSTSESLAHVLTEKVYPPKGVIYYQGNEVEDLFFVQQGRVKVPSHPQIITSPKQLADSLCMPHTQLDKYCNLTCTLQLISTMWSESHHCKLLHAA